MPYPTDDDFKNYPINKQAPDMTDNIALRRLLWLQEYNYKNHADSGAIYFAPVAVQSSSGVVVGSATPGMPGYPGVLMPIVTTAAEEVRIQNENTAPLKVYVATSAGVDEQVANLAGAQVAGDGTGGVIYIGPVNSAVSVLSPVGSVNCVVGVWTLV